MAIGDLTVKVGADFAEFVRGLVQAENQAKTSFKRIGEVAAGVAIGNKLGGFISDIVTALPRMTKAAIDAADHLNDLSKSTGVAVETLGGIGFAASQAGSSLDGAAGAIGKLNQTLAKAAGGSKEASAALKSLGVEAIDPLTGKTIAVDKALVQIADAFEKAGDSPEKFRAAAAALGKKYAELAPLLQDGGKALLQQIEYYKKHSGVTKEAAERADKFNDELGKLKLLSQSAGQALASELLGPLQSIVEYLVKAREEGSGFGVILGTIRNILEVVAVVGSDVAFIVEQIAKGLGLVGEASVKIANLDFSGAKTLFTKYNEDAAEARKNLDRFQSAVLFRANPDDAGREGRGRERAKPPIPGIPDASAAAEADAARKKLLDGQLKQIQAFAEQQRDALAFANKYLEGEYQDGLVSLQNYFDDQANIRKRALRVQLDEQDAIIAAQKKFKAETSNPTSKLEAQNKIDEATAAKTRSTVKAQQEEQLALQQTAREAAALTSTFAGVNAQLLELQENFAAAAAARFDLQNSTLRRTLTANLDSPDARTAQAADAALRANDAFRAAAIAQGAFQKAALESSRTLEALGNAEERVALLQQTGAIGSIEALSELGKARQKQIPFLEAQVAAEEAIAKAAKAAGTLGADDLIRKAEAGRLALDKLKASADPLAESLNRMFGDEFESALTDFVTGTKSASEAFKSFTKSVLNDILKLGSKSIAESLFGGSGGIGGYLSDLFKSQSGGGDIFSGAKSLLGFGGGFGGGRGVDPGASEPDAGAVAEITKLFDSSGAVAAKAAETSAIGATTTAMAALTTAASAAANSLALISATSSTSEVGDLASLFGGSGGDAGFGTGVDYGSFDYGAFLAKGTNYVPRDNFKATLHKGEAVVPAAFNPAAGGVAPGTKSTTQTISVNVQGAPNQSRDSLLQQGAVIGQGIQKALARNT